MRQKVTHNYLNFYVLSMFFLSILFYCLQFYCFCISVLVETVQSQTKRQTHTCSIFLNILMSDNNLYSAGERRENKRATPWENQQSAYAKTKAQISFAVTAKLISAFIFATRIVQFLFYLNPKFQASSSFL